MVINNTKGEKDGMNPGGEVGYEYQGSWGRYDQYNLYKWMELSKNKNYFVFKKSVRFEHALAHSLMTINH